MAEANDPGARERGLLGGRILGTRPVQDAVTDLGKNAKALSTTLAEVTKVIHGIVQESKGKGRTSSSTWNSGSQRGAQGGLANGGQISINKQAASFGLGNAGLAIPGVAGMPANRTTYAVEGNHAAVPPGGGNGGNVTFGKSAGGYAASAGAAVVQWSHRNYPLLSQSDMIGTQAYNNGGLSGSIDDRARGLLGNNATGSGVQDQMATRQYMMGTFGVAGYGAPDRVSGVLNPEMSNMQVQQARGRYTSAQGINALRPWGIKSIDSRGHALSVPQINQNIAQRFGLDKAMTNQQRQDTFFNQTSGINRSLQSQGYSADQIELFDTQAAGEARVRQQGGDVDRFHSLLNQAGKSAGKGANTARQALAKEFNYNVPLQQGIKGAAASSVDKNLETLHGFRTSVFAATGSIGAFNKALQKILKGPLGDTLGAAGGVTSSVGPVGSAAATVGGGILGHAAQYMLTKRMISRAVRSAGPKAGSSLVSTAESAGGRVAGAAGAVGGTGLSVLGHAGKLAGILGMGAYAWKERPWGPNGIPLLGGGQTQPAPKAKSGNGNPGWFNSASNSVRGWFGMDAKNEEDEGKGGPGDGIDASVVVARAAGYARGGTNWGVGHCQTFVRTCMGSPGGASSATAAWSAAKFKHSGDANPPAGAPVYWTGGSRGYGHVAVSAGGGMCYSTDVRAPGRVSLIGISWINQHWRSVHYVGWAEDNNGIRVKVGKASPMSGAGADAGVTPGGSTSDSKSATAGGGAMGAGFSMAGSYGSVNESDAIAGALGSAGSVAGPGGASNAEGSTDAPGVTAAAAGGPQTSGKMPTVKASGVRGIVQQMAASRGWTGSQWDALNQLVQHESSWNPNAANSKSSARGLFQKMTSMHGAIEGSVQGQAKWGLNYIEDRYGDPVKAWSFWQKHHSYAKGSFNIEADQNATVHKGEMIVPARQAEEIRQALLSNSVPEAARAAGRGDIRLEFGPGSVVFKVDGSMDEASGRKAAKQFAKYLSEDDRLRKMGVGV